MLFRPALLGVISSLSPLMLGAQQPRAPAAGTVAGTMRVAHFRDASEGFTQYSGIPDSLRLVIRDTTAWRDYWSAIHRPFIPAPPLPEVDFAREMIVLASLGTRSSAGFGIRIEHAIVDSTRLLLSVRRTIPGNGCALAAVVTQPLDLVRIPVTSLPIAFAERVERTDCSPGQALRRDSGI